MDMICLHYSSAYDLRYSSLCCISHQGQVSNFIKVCLMLWLCKSIHCHLVIVIYLYSTFACLREKYSYFVYDFF